MANIETELKQIAERIEQQADRILTEEATKMAIVSPFLRILGYDTSNPSEVIPEFTADAVGKKGEKVDYAILLDNEIVMLVECKKLGVALDRKHLAQLYRYFSVTSAQFALLTNGQIFEFYASLEEQNKLDKKPFFILDLLKLNNRDIVELEKFEKTRFDTANILRNAERLKYVSSIKKFLSSQVDEPSDEFTKFVASNVYEGRVTQSVRETIEWATKIAFNEFITEKVHSRLSSALQNSSNEKLEDLDGEVSEDEIITTPEEIEGMITIRSIVRDILDPSRVDLRDAKSYCAVLIDDNNRQPLARMHFNRKQWYLGLFDKGIENRVAISSLTDIFKYAEPLRETAKRYVK